MNRSTLAWAMVATGLLASACGGDTAATTTTARTGTFETRLADVATLAGLDVPAWQACRADPAMEARVVADMTLGVAAGVGGTPTFLVNGEPVVGNQPASVFRSAIQAARTRAQASGLAAADYYATTFPGLPVGTSPSTGPADAWVTVVEFSDFECPYCAAVQGTLQSVLSTAGSDVRHVWKHFPLSFHAGARPTAIAAECARAQGRFWEFHDLVFARQSSLY
ncbi:MAG: thioredoxin domain-containing protein [Anaeromyxobacteraceae bacterium]